MRARVEEFVDVVSLDAADGQNRQSATRRELGKARESGCGTGAILRLRAVHRPKAHVIGVVSRCRARHRRRVGRHADDGVGTQQAACHLCGQVLLPYVRAVGAGCERDVHAVVHEERHARSRAHFTRRVDSGEQVARRRSLVPKLYAVGASVDRAAGEFDVVVFGLERRVRDDKQTRDSGLHARVRQKWCVGPCPCPICGACAMAPVM